ncbi:MAG: hypothetical protein A3J37_04745 [Alphaproteobacteria bacterium RIFCSPHIGHO2_12_FULL_45_9]|nr:MAG: hypothetical protein A3B66_07645 [Alphaproteobacteria bacterium RIFCSPHIGHO2_02_FULL_46_13]OFW98201.1 MAG: hypothetical protein A3J37_04745 [Alphaproteobacteria bacterium RIFCSPHIGHO2_12_FULL_45_9]
MTSVRSLLALACTSSLLSACYSDMTVMRDDAAKRTAAPVFMIPRDIPTTDFIIQSYERVYKKGQPATIYIEGDGTYTVAVKAFSKDNPTPTDPVALRMAAQDKGDNVIWVARPCQYNKGWKGDKKSCPVEYSTNKRFAPEVIETYNQVLDNIKSYYNIPSFDLVGYDGGAAIAVILGSQRADIKSIRTVAGDLDPNTVANLNKKPHPEGSLNPMDFAAGIANIPQRHFIGKLDTTTPPAVYNSFAQAVSQGQCLNVSLVDNADHQSGWAEQWKVLKSIPIDCAQPAELIPVQFDPTPLDGDKYHIQKKHK